MLSATFAPRDHFLNLVPEHLSIGQSYKKTDGFGFDILLLEHN